MKLKFNGNYYSKAKINGKFISLIKVGVNLYKNGIINDTDKNLTYYFSDANNNILTNYTSLCKLNPKSGFNNFNELNIIPSEAEKIVGIDSENNLYQIENEIIVKKPNLGNKLYSVVVMSDIHIDAYEDDYGYSQNDFINALNFYNSNGVDFMIINGDLVNEGYEVDYQKYVELVTNYSNNIPIKTIKGNHECYYDGGYDDTNTRYDTYVGQPNYYEFVYNNDVYLFLSAMREDGNNLTVEQTDWLTQKLEQYQSNRVFLFTHYPYGEVGSIGNIVDKTQMSNSTFINLIKKYKNIVYFSGHTHTNFEEQLLNKFANIKKSDTICNRVHISSLARPRYWDGTQLVNEPAGSQGYIMEVYDNGILLKGYDFSLQKYVGLAQYFLEI